jgi:hypothetical protein
MNIQKLTVNYTFVKDPNYSTGEKKCPNRNYYIKKYVCTSMESDSFALLFCRNLTKAFSVLLSSAIFCTLFFSAPRPFIFFSSCYFYSCYQFQPI